MLAELMAETGMGAHNARMQILRDLALMQLTAVLLFWQYVTQVVRAYGRPGGAPYAFVQGHYGNAPRIA